MAQITISADLSSDGTYIILRDLTPLEEYNSTGIDIDNDIVSVTYKLTDNEIVPNEYTVDVTSAFPTYIRDIGGYIITTADLGYPEEFIPDGRWTSTLEIVENSVGVDVTQTGISDDIFLSQILQVMTSQIIDADWKELYNPHNVRLSSDLRKRQLFISIIYSAQAGLLDNAESQRLALNKLCSYVG